jgi:hypothetical protein
MSQQDESRIITQSLSRPAGGRDVVLEARAARLRAPFGGLVWNRPVAVRVRESGGEQRLAIRDVTRRGQVAAYGLSLVLVLVGLSLRPRKRREER